MNIVTLTQPASEPVTLPELLTQCLVTHQNDNDYVVGLGAAAREYVEASTGISCLSATYRQTWDQFPLTERLSGDVLRLMRNPLLEVVSVKYFDTTGVERTLDPSLYVVDADGRPARIGIAPGESWPSTECGRLNAVSVTYRAGHNLPADVPHMLKAAIKQLVAHWYENRQPVVTGTIASDIPFTVISLLRLCRIRGIH